MFVISYDFAAILESEYSAVFFSEQTTVYAFYLHEHNALSANRSRYRLIAENG